MINTFISLRLKRKTYPALETHLNLICCFSVLSGIWFSSKIGILLIPNFTWIKHVRDYCLSYPQVGALARRAEVHTQGEKVFIEYLLYLNSIFKVLNSIHMTITNWKYYQIKYFYGSIYQTGGSKRPTTWFINVYIMVQN